MRKHFIKHVVFAWVAIAGFGAIVMLLWSCLIPGIFGLGVINFWQSLGLLALAHLLFGRLGGRFWRVARGGAMRSHQNPIREKWEKMPPEERKEFINKRHEFSCRRPFGRHDFFGTRNFDFDNELKKENE
jgi:hypothetical protein